MADALTMAGVALALTAVGTAFALGALVSWLAELIDRRRWDELARRRPYLKKE